MGKDSIPPGVAELASGLPTADAQTGAASTRALPCPECGGDGGWERPTGSYNVIDGSVSTTWQECRACDGSGEAEFTDFAWEEVSG